jgi:hypothetical protein
MSRFAGRCPNCSAPIEFRWSSAVQTVCAHCRSVVVRHDVNLDAIGEVSDLPVDSSPIQLGTTGRVDAQSFTVIGRIAYEHDEGGWNEWHLAFADGSSGWLSDAQAEYAVSALVKPPRPLPPPDSLQVGTHYRVHDEDLHVTTLTRARYKGVDGELPFEYWGKDEVLFADFRGYSGAFATVDYSDEKPLLFAGRLAEYDDLSLANVRTFDGAAAVQGTRGFNCANCGAAVELRALTHTRGVACTSCAAILDPRDPNVSVLQRAAGQARVSPTIPLGTRGTWHGHPYDVVGFQCRSIEVDGVPYGWHEYVLFNPYRGFRYLSEYEHHWNDIRTVRELPYLGGHGKRRRAEFREESFRHFQSAWAQTDFVLGEFPWRVRVGDRVAVADYVSPPHMLSSEATEGETTWSLGVYTDARRIWEAFDLPGRPEGPSGIFANEPSPYAHRLRPMFETFGGLALLLLVMLVGRQIFAAREELFSQSYTYRPPAGSGDPAFVTDPFTVREEGTVEIGLEADVSNSWLDFDLALINLETGTALNVQREVSYFYGTDSDGRWSEGGRRSRVLLPTVPAGDYYLRVEPSGAGTPIGYRIRVRRDVPALMPYGVGLVLLLLPPGLLAWGAASFEHRRWQESDHAPSDD